MKEDVTVRVGVPEDLEQVMDLARMMHEEIGISAFNAERVLPGIYGALHQDHGIMGVIGPVGGQIEGGILLSIGQTFYSDEDILEEKGLFIHPDFRSARGGRAARLCEFAKQASEFLTLPLLIGVLNDVRTQGKLKLYERQFGAPIGAFFLHRPPVAQATAEAA